VNAPTPATDWQRLLLGLVLAVGCVVLAVVQLRGHIRAKSAWTWPSARAVVAHAEEHRITYRWHISGTAVYAVCPTYLGDSLGLNGAGYLRTPKEAAAPPSDVGSETLLRFNPLNPSQCTLRVSALSNFAQALVTGALVLGGLAGALLARAAFRQPLNGQPSVAMNSTSLGVPQKYYSTWQITVATVLGGPLAGGYFASRDHAFFGAQKKASITMIVSGLLLIAAIVAGFLLPEKESRTPGAFLIALGYRWYASAAFDSKIATQRAAGAVPHSWWGVIGISLGVLVAMFLCVFIGMLLWGGSSP
jgi:hypothetical protein